MATYLMLYIMLVFSHSKRFESADDVVCNNVMFAVAGVFNGLLMMLLLCISIYASFAALSWVGIGVLISGHELTEICRRMCCCRHFHRPSQPRMRVFTCVLVRLPVLSASPISLM